MKLSDTVKFYHNDVTNEVSVAPPTGWVPEGPPPDPTAEAKDINGLSSSGGSGTLRKVQEALTSSGGNRARDMKDINGLTSSGGGSHSRKNSVDTSLIRSPTTTSSSTGTKDLLQAFANISSGNIPQLKPMPGEFQVLTFKCPCSLPSIPNMYGVVVLTNYRLVFLSWDVAFTNDITNEILYEFPCTNLFRVVDPHVITPLTVTITLLGRDVRTVAYRFHLPSSSEKEKMADVDELIRLLHIYAYPNEITKTFAYSYRHVLSSEDGWLIYDPPREYNRQGLFTFSSIKYTMMDNSSFKYCPTYPAFFLLPSDLNEDELKDIRNFRSKGRVPALAYFYKASGAVMLRAAQPLTG